MASTRTQHVVGGGLGTFRQRDRANWQRTQRTSQHRNACAAMIEAAAIANVRRAFPGAELIG